MSENFENGNWVHVDAYTKDDGTQVREHWRRKYAGQVQYDNNNVLHADLHYDVINNGADKKEYQKYLEQKFVDVGKYTLRELDKLPEPIKNIGEDIVVSGVNKTTKGAIDGLGSVFATIMETPTAYELYKVASPNKGYNMEYVKKNGTLYNSSSELGDEKIEQKIKAWLQHEKTGMTDCKVFKMHENSELSQKIANSDEMKEILKKDIDMLRYAKVLPEKHIDFKTPDLYNSLHGANMTYAKLDKEGNLVMRFEDLWNFNESSTSLKSKVGRKLQDYGGLEPYYAIIEVKIPKSELDKY